MAFSTEQRKIVLSRNCELNCIFTPRYIVTWNDLDEYIRNIKLYSFSSVESKNIFEFEIFPWLAFFYDRKDCDEEFAEKIDIKLIHIKNIKESDHDISFRCVYYGDYKNVTLVLNKH